MRAEFHACPESGVPPGRCVEELPLGFAEGTLSEYLLLVVWGVISLVLLLASRSVQKSVSVFNESWFHALSLQSQSQILEIKCANGRFPK
jgi:hypothetical protein